MFLMYINDLIEWKIAYSPTSLFTTPYLQNCLNSWWHKLNKVLEHPSEILVHIDVTQLLQIFGVKIHDENLLFNQNPKGNSTELRFGDWGSLEYRGHVVMFKKPNMTLFTDIY